MSVCVVVVALVGAVLPAVTSAPAVADDGRGSASVRLAKTVSGARLAPSLAVVLGAVPATATPGDRITYAATLTNNGAALSLSGELSAKNTSRSSATVASWFDYLATNTNSCSEDARSAAQNDSSRRSGDDCEPDSGQSTDGPGPSSSISPKNSGTSTGLNSGDNSGDSFGGACSTGHEHDTAQWPPLAGIAGAQQGYTPSVRPIIATGLQLSATPVPTSGVNYASGGDRLVGTKISAGKTATWHYQATIQLTATQLAALLDPNKTKKTRNTFHLEVTPRSRDDSQQAFVDVCKRGIFGVSSPRGTVTNATISIQPPTGPPASFTAPGTPGLASLAQGASVSVSTPYVVPAPGPRGPAETDGAYLARLQGANGRVLQANASANGTSSGGAISAVAKPVATTEQLPVLSITKSGPPTALAGSTANFPLTLANQGAAPASTIAVVDSIAGGAQGTVSGLPATLAAGASANGQAAYAIPAGQKPGQLADTAAVTWQDPHGNAYGPLGASTSSLVTVPGANQINPISTTTVQGNFYAADPAATSFVAKPGDTPAFAQSFPTIEFNPPAKTINGEPANGPKPNTRPFTDVTTDLKGNYSGTVIAQGNGLQAGLGTVTAFDAELEGTFNVTTPGPRTFTIVHNDGFILGIGNGATSSGGPQTNPPAGGTTPFKSYPVAAANNTTSATVTTDTVTVSFPAAGAYPYELDYFAATPAGPLTLTLASAGSSPSGGGACPGITEFPTSAAPYSITTGPDGNLWFTEPSPGQAIGQMTPAGVVTTFAAPGDPVGIAKGPDGDLWFTDQAHNTVVRMTTTGSETPFPVPTPGGALTGISAGPDGNLWFAETGANRIGRITPAGAVSEFVLPSGTPGAGNAGVERLIPGPDGNVWFVEGSVGKIGLITPSGAITEYPLSNPASETLQGDLTVGQDGNIWFSEAGASQVGRITPAGVITEFGGLPANSGATGIAAGPDGNLWLLEQTANAIAKVSTSGVATQCGTVPTPNAHLLYMTAGPDGNMWFAEYGTNKIGRISVGAPPACTVSKSTPTVTNYPGMGGPVGITTGPDGALWFTNNGNNSIGRITTTGLITTYTGVGISGPYEITAGPDGALWFTNAGNNSIGRITTAGVVTNYTGTAISGPVGITTGPDGALWFTNNGNNSIGRITTAGVVTNYTDPSISAPYEIVAGPDGALWFANGTNASIGRITTVGVFTNYTGGGISNPVGLTIGSDGALWFTNNGNNSIGRITTTGVITNFTGTGISGPEEIAAGADGALWFTNDRNNSIGRITTNGAVTNFTGTGVSSPEAIRAGPDGALWFVNWVGNYSIGRITTTGTITNYANINHPSGIETGPDGALWFGNFGNNSIGRITTNGVVANYTGTGINEPSRATPGPDGALWFTNAGNNTIGRITTAGVVTNYPDPSINHPSGMAAGPDGALWWLNNGNNTIGRITTTGVVSNYTGTGISDPRGITPGPDGALWFTNAGNNTIGRITTAGVVSNYTGTGISGPINIFTGPDGALWFTNSSNNTIGRITTAGVVSNYTGTGISDPVDIVAGPDGALWFTNYANNSIGRITTSGVVTNYTGTGISGPNGITAGPDGALWFTNYTNNSIGRITTGCTSATAYVSNRASNTVTPINLANNSPGTPIPVGTQPGNLAVTPTGTWAYVTNLGSNTVTPINLANNTPGTAIPVGTTPGDLAITPDGTTAYVTNDGSNTVTPINLANNTPGTPIPVGTNPHAIAITPNGATAYVANYASNTVTPINLANNTPGAPIPVGTQPGDLAITPDGTTAYVVDAGDNAVTPINLANNTPGTPIPMSAGTGSIAITPDGITAYVANRASNTVTPINLANNTPGTAIPVGTTPVDIAITPDGSTAYVTNIGSNTVTPINLTNNTPGTPIPVGTEPLGITIGGPVAAGPPPTGPSAPLPPAAALTLTPASIPGGATTGQSETFTAAAMDGTGTPVSGVPVTFRVAGANQQQLTATTDGAGIATATYVGANSGTDSVLATATIAGQSATSNVTVFVWSAPPAGPPPSISAPTPTDGALVSKPVPVSATFAPPTGQSIASWKVTYQGVSPGSPTVTLRSGSGTPPATLATFDPTILPNDTYAITISATASGGGTQSIVTTVAVFGNLKLGRYTTTYQDLNVPVNGFQMQVRRVYDSIDKRVGDFGVGWHVDVSNFRVSTNRQLGAGGWVEYTTNCFILCSWAYRDTGVHFVTATFPDGHQEMFDFTPTGPQNTLVDFESATTKFTARTGTGTTSTLEDARGPVTLTPGGDGSLYESNNQVYAPTRFKLTTKDGRVFVLDTTSGLVSETDPNGNSLTTDASGVHASNGESITYQRDTAGRITKITGPSGQTLGYSYSPAGDLASSTDPNNNTTTYDYDTNHNLLDAKGPGGQALQKQTYGPDGRLATITDGAGNTTKVTDNVSGQQQTVVDPIGSLTTVYAFDDLGDLVRQDRVSGAQTLTTTWVYDAVGRPIKMTDPLGKTSTAAYDASGIPIAFVDPAGNETAITSNAMGQPTAITDPSGTVALTATYDPQGNLTGATTRGGSSMVGSYDSSGHLVQAVDGQGNTTKFAYDNAGNVTRATDPLGNATQASFDASGRLASFVDSTGASTSYAYDAAGQLTSMTDPRGAARTFVYDALGRVTSTQDPFGTAIYNYDGAGRVTSVTAPDGTKTSYAYDGDGRLTSSTGPSGDVTTFRYDAFGRLVETTNAVSDVTRTYDADGQLLSETTFPLVAGGPPPVTLSYSYNAVGGRASRTGPDGTTSYAYDVLGRLTTLTDPAGGTFGLTYDSDSRPVQLTRPNGVTDTVTYDALGRLTRRTSTHGATTVADAKYQLDAASRRISLTDLTGITTFVHDAVGRLTKVTPPTGGSTNYTYDNAGNRLTPGSAPGGTYSYDTADRLVGDNNITYTYDALGRLTKRVNHTTNTTTGFTWNGENQLAQITNPDGTATTYQYDPLGRRVGLTHAGQTTHYAYDGDNIAYEFDGAGNLTASYVFLAGVDQPLEMVRGNQRSYYIQDGNSNVVALTDNTGATSATYRYDTFGQPLSSTGTVTNPFTFGAREYDPASGLYYNRARYYDPATGRFISPDPVGAQNPYPYVASDPVDNIDPSGALFAEYAPLLPQQIQLGTHLAGFARCIAVAMFDGLAGAFGGRGDPSRVNSDLSGAAGQFSGITDITGLVLGSPSDQAQSATNIAANLIDTANESLTTTTAQAVGSIRVTVRVSGVFIKGVFTDGGFAVAGVGGFSRTRTASIPILREVENKPFGIFGTASSVWGDIQPGLDLQGWYTNTCQMRC